MQEFLRMLTITKESQEIERKRRIVWEQEQEAKFTQRHAEMEKQILEMKQEIVSLKAFVGLRAELPANDQRQPAAGTFQRQDNASPMGMQQPTPQMSLSPVSHSSYANVQSTFVQGSSNQPFQQPMPVPVQSHFPDLMIIEPPSPQFIAVESSRLRPSSIPANSRKRPTPDIDSDDESSKSDDDDESPPPRPVRRANGHDSRCLTIQVCSNFFICHFSRVALKTYFIS